jgi:hypothetical protein
MKKVYLISAITIILGFLFTYKLYWFGFFWVRHISLLFLTAGVLMVLVQKDDKNSRLVLRLIAGSLLTGLVFTFFWQMSIGRFFWQSILSALFFSFICLSGGVAVIVIRRIILLYKKNPEAKLILALRKVFGGIFLCAGAAGLLASLVIFLILVFNPASSLLNLVMVDFKLIEISGVTRYYLLLLSAFFIVLIPLAFFAILGLALVFFKKNFINLRLFFILILLFFLGLPIFFSQSAYLENKFDEKKAAMKSSQTEKNFNLKNFNSIYVSRFVAFDEITIKQGDQFNVVASGSPYDLIGLDFKKINGDTLFIERSELEAYYNTKTWKMENDNIPFAAGTKYLKIEITMPDIKKIELDGGHLKLDNFKVDNIEIKLNKRFNEIKGDIAVKDTLKLDAAGGVINFTGSAKNVIINSGDCWIEMDKFITENAIINAKNTSRLNVNVSGNMEIRSNENSGITNHNGK